MVTELKLSRDGYSRFRFVSLRKSEYKRMQPLRLEENKVPRPKQRKLKAPALKALKERVNELLRTGENQGVRDLEHLAKLLGGVHRTTVDKYLRADVGPPPKRMLELALVHHLLRAGPLAYDAGSQIKAVKAWLDELNLGDLMNEEEITAHVSEVLPALQSGLGLEDAALKKFDPGIAWHMRICADSQKRMIQEIKDFCRHWQQTPIVMAFVWEWHGDQTIARFSPKGRRGVELVRWLLEHLLDFPKLHIWGAFTVPAGGGSDGPIRIKKLREELDGAIASAVQDSTVPLKAINERIRFFVGQHSDYSALADYWLLLPVYERRVRAFATSEHEELLSMALRSGVPEHRSNPWMWSTMVVDYDEARSQRVQEYFGFKFAEIDDAELKPPWSPNSNSAFSWKCVL